MCMFCAAAPMAASLGIAAEGKWRERRKEAQKLGQPVPRRILPFKAAAFAVTAGCVVAAVIYHSTIATKTGL